MAQDQIRRAALLLAKAVSTDSPEEQAALALRSYCLLAEFLNAHESASGQPRRRERRLLRDRRARRQGDSAPSVSRSAPARETPPSATAAAPPTALTAAATAAYRRFSATAPPRCIDVQV